MKKILIPTFFFLLLMLAFPSKAWAVVLFHDDFDDGNANGWAIDYLTPPEGDNSWNSSKWEVNSDGEYGITFISTQMRTISSAGDSDWYDYVYTIELTGKSGIDKNIVFHFQDKDNWYGFHLRDDGIRFGVMKDGEYFDNNGEQLSTYPFGNNTTYLLKVLARGNFVSFFINGQCVIENLEISDDYVIPNGKIGLYASTGDSSSYASVWFDNITVCTIDDPCDYSGEYFQRSPVILIPGHGASISFKGMFLGQEDADDWRMVPGAHVYDNLIKALGENGYEEGKDLAVFYYNWLMPIDNSAEKLCQLAAQMAGRSPTGKVNLVGHSMGGLVARTCAQKYDPQHLVKNLVTVGSPHQGVPESYGAWEGGEIWKGGFINKFAFELFLNIKKTLTGNKTRKETVREVAPSTKELMPVFDYLKNVDGQVIPFSATDYPQNEFLSEFPSWGDFSGQAKFVYGQGKDTLRWLTVDKDLSWKDKALGNWQYGKPINLGYEKDGDGTVSVISAYPAKASFPFTSFELAHREIVSKDIAVNQILKYLDIEATINAEPVPDAVDYLAFYLLSPAYLEINLTGIPAKDIFIGQEEPGRPKLIIIANPPPNWEKEVVVKGVDEDNGEYVLGVGLARGEKISWQEYPGEIKENEEDHFLFEFSDKISLQLKEIEERKSQDPDQEMFNQLQTGFSSSPLLTEKLKRLKTLMKISPFESLKYAYRIKNLVALEAKEKGASLNDLNQMNKKLEQFIVYLEAAAENGEEIYSEGKAALAYQETKTLLEELEPLSPLSDNLFVVPAAQSLTLAEESLPVSLPKNWGELIRLGRGYFLGINSKILLN